MAREIRRLSAREVANEKVPGYHPDGGGLYLQVSPAITKSWVFRYTLRGRAREMGLGPLHAVSLADAREQAIAARRALVDGNDPLELRRAARAGQRLIEARSRTFAACATAYIAAHRPGWKNAKHADQWTATLQTYAEPVFGTIAVQDVDTALVTQALEPIWTTKHETATRVRARIERVLDWATARGYRQGENPARWRGHLDKLLPAISKRKRVVHHPALPFSRMGKFVRELREQQGLAALALEFTILTACRTSEVINARWDEFDLPARVWSIPKERMKAHREHRVPLSARAVAILKTLRPLGHGDFVFPGPREGKALSNMAMLQLLKRMGRGDLTVHGFRSSFRDWTSERTNFPREVCEAALAHTIPDQVEAAYRRGDLFDKRVKLMSLWADHCGVTDAEGNVLPLARTA